MVIKNSTNTYALHVQSFKRIPHTKLIPSHHPVWKFYISLKCFYLIWSSEKIKGTELHLRQLWAILQLAPVNSTNGNSTSLLNSTISSGHTLQWFPALKAFLNLTPRQIWPKIFMYFGRIMWKITMGGWHLKLLLNTIKYFNESMFFWSVGHHEPFMTRQFPQSEQFTNCQV